MIFDIGAQNDFFTAVTVYPTTKHIRVPDSYTAAGNHLRPVLKSDYQVFVALQPTAEIDNQRSAAGYQVECPVVDHMM